MLPLVLQMVAAGSARLYKHETVSVASAAATCAGASFLHGSLVLPRQLSAARPTPPLPTHFRLKR